MYLEVWEPCARCAGTGTITWTNEWEKPKVERTQSCRCNAGAHPGYLRRLLPLAEVLAQAKEQAE